MDDLFIKTLAFNIWPTLYNKRVPRYFSKSYSLAILSEKYELAIFRTKLKWSEDYHRFINKKCMIRVTMNFDTLVQIAVGLFIVGLVATIFYEKIKTKTNQDAEAEKSRS